jgi:hypothetical protein
MNRPLLKLIPERNRLIRLLAFPYLTLASLLALGFMLYREQIEQIAFCPLRQSLGWPCPTCGGTHSALALARLDLAEAFTLNPLVTMAAVAFAAWGLYAVIATLAPRLRREIVISQQAKIVLRMSVVSALLAGWIYQWLRLHS